MLFKLFLAGWGIIITAIVFNAIALSLEIVTWYSFLEEINKMGFYKAFLELTIPSKLFLMVIYPLVLGLISFLILRVTKKKI